MKFFPCTARVFALAWLAGFSYSGAGAQTALPFTPLPLDNLSGFRPAAANWQIAGGVTADRNKDQFLQPSAGKGTLVNIPGDKNKDNLFTTLEHGNVELELEFMMAKGSNSGIYLQGRYEIQLFDSWGAERPHHSDCGGIYQRWNEQLPEDRRGFEGHPPRVNVSRAPGLWQTMKIVFQAPTFDAGGRKLSNARFVKVVHNGVTVHENVEVTGPTRSAAFTDEKPTGPLMLQGDHGPVAFRNIQYKRYDHPPVQLRDLQYSYYEGKFTQATDFTQSKPKKTGKADGSTQLIESANDFALQLKGNLQVPAAGDYLFELQCMGGAQLSIDDKNVITYNGFHYPEEWASGQTNLSAGSHPFTIRYFRSKDPWLRSQLTAYVEGPGVVRQRLAIPTALPEPEYIEPIQVRTTETTMLRSFVLHHNRKKTHCISVGDPGGIHYTVDLQQGSLLQVWKGGFIDATDMWHERGEPQLARPLGSAISLSGEPVLAALNSQQASWPDSIGKTDNFQFKGYSLDEQGHPSFRYLLNGLEVRDLTVPDAQKRTLTRQLRLKGAQSGDLYCLVATGNRIAQLPDGTYSVDDQSYYVEIEAEGSAKPIIRKSRNREELLIPLRLKDNQAALQYKLIW